MCRECQCDACKEQGDSGKSHRESVFHIDCTYRYAFHQMDRDSFDQCTVDSAGSIRPEYFAEYEGISFLFCGIFHFFRSAGTSGVVLYKCCDRSDDRVDRIGDLLFYLCLWTEVCVVNKDPFKEYVKQSEPGKRDKGYAWHTAIGLQAVDGLQPSQYLLDTAIET